MAPLNLKTYVHQEYGGVTALARRLRVSVSLVSMWASGERAVPADWCLEIERVTEGQLKVEVLRPDINWKRHRKQKVA